MIELLGLGVNTEHNTPQAIPKSQLAETEAEKLLPAGKGFHVPGSLVLLDTLLEGVTGQDIGELAENILAGVHKKKKRMESHSSP